MKTTVAASLAVSALLALGGASAVWAQSATTFTGAGCSVNFAQFPGQIPALLQNQVWATTDTEKKCPGTPNSPTVILNCFGVVENWDSAFVVNTSAFSCTLSGAQCGYSGQGTSTSQRLTIDPSGNLELRCSANRGAFP